jgi:hypothetical protein
MLRVVRLVPFLAWAVVVGAGLTSCAQADEPEAQVANPDGGLSGSGGAAGQAGGGGTSGGAGDSGASGQAGSAGEAGATGGTSGGAGDSGVTGGTGGYAGTGGSPTDAAPEGGIVCGVEICTDWLCEKSNVGVTMTVYGCCQQTNECGAVNEQGGSLCVPVAVVENLLGMTCQPAE